MMASRHHGAVWAVVPVKRLTCAKQRLSNVLNNMQRANLALAMFSDLLHTLLSLQGLAGIAVISNDPLVRFFAQDRALLIEDKQESGTNAAVEQAVRFLSMQGHHRVMVMPSDIPFAQVAELQRVLDALDDQTIVLASDRRGVGTNLLAGHGLDLIGTCFGEDSFRLHLSRVRLSKQHPHILHSPGVHWDIDTPDDLRVDPQLICPQTGLRTLALLERFAADRHVPLPRPELLATMPSVW